MEAGGSARLGMVRSTPGIITRIAPDPEILQSFHGLNKCVTPNPGTALHRAAGLGVTHLFRLEAQDQIGAHVGHAHIGHFHQALPWARCRLLTQGGGRSPWKLPRVDCGGEVTKGLAFVTARGGCAPFVAPARGGMPVVQA